MQRHFDDELIELKQKILRMGALVEDQLQQATKALIDRDVVLAQQVIEAAEQGDAKPLELLTQALQSPFTRRPELEHFDAAAPTWASCLSISCSS